MAFMEHDIKRFDAWRVETTEGTEIVPCDVEQSPENLADYCNGTPNKIDLIGLPEHDTIDAVRVLGWYCRLSAPGYLDWSGPFETAQEAEDYLNEMFDEDESDDESEV